MRRTLAAFAILVVAVGSSACGGSDPLKGGADSGAGGPVTVGSADFPENQLLAEIYAGALRKAGIDVKVNAPVSSREVAITALKDKSLTVIPEYTGNLLFFFDKPSTASKPDEVYSALKAKIAAELEVLDKAPAEDKDVLVVTKQTADQLSLKSMADLGPKCPQLVFGAAGEWKGRWESKIKELYGCTFKEIRTTDAGGPVTVKAVTAGEVQVVNLFTTASAIGANNLVQLEDPKQMYPAQNVVPLARKGALSDKAKTALNQLAPKLTTDKLSAAVKKIEVDKANVVDTAKEFLSANGL